MKVQSILISPCHGGSHGRRVTRSWHPQASWSAKTTDRELNKFAANLENELTAGKIQTRAEKIAAKKSSKSRGRENQNPCAIRKRRVYARENRNDFRKLTRGLSKIFG
ncbi:MAG: hypothetical protein LUC36_00440 [Oscillospiraceae bacterium]|nr:hypothetical protein [Oscillospiraceae bacterium]